MKQSALDQQTAILFSKKEAKTNLILVSCKKKKSNFRLTKLI
jgi:hypothetical protein